MDASRMDTERRQNELQVHSQHALEAKEIAKNNKYMEEVGNKARSVLCLCREDIAIRKYLSGAKGCEADYHASAHTARDFVETADLAIQKRTLKPSVRPRHSP